MKKLFFIFCLSLTALATQGQKNPFIAKLSQDTVLLGNAFVLTFTLNNVAGDYFEPPHFSDFRVVSGPNQSAFFSMNNGEVLQSISYSFHLEPLKTGHHFIPPAYIHTEEKTFETSPLEVVVVDNPDGIIQEPEVIDNEFELFHKKGPEIRKNPNKKRKVYKI